MGCLGEMTCKVEDLMSNLIAFQRTFDPGRSDDNWYHNL